MMMMINFFDIDRQIEEHGTDCLLATYIENSIVIVMTARVREFDLRTVVHQMKQKESGRPTDMMSINAISVET